jgi:hypothetical protein
MSELVIVSAIYYSSIGMLFFSNGWTGPYGRFFLLFGVPTVIGILIGALYQKRLFDWIAEKTTIRPVHPAETAWDFAFGRLKNPCWIIVTTTSGKKIRGWFSSESGASSDLSKRDLFLFDVRKDDYSPYEGDGRKRGMWIREDEIKFIEFIPD